MGTKIMRMPVSPATTNPPPPDLVASRGAFDKQLIELLPKLRAFAWKLCRNDSESDDLVQATVAKALAAYQGFQMGTNMRAWAFTILKNHRTSQFRNHTLQMEELTDAIVLLDPVKANQEGSLELNEVLGAMGRLKPAHRDVLKLVRVLGHDYGNAARLMACPVGTIKSRLNRADAALRAVIDRAPIEIRPSDPQARR